MSLFKIKLQPIVKDRDWDIKTVNSSRKQKTCGICGKSIPLTVQSTTFTKRTNLGFKQTFETHYTCGTKNSPCSIHMANKLNIL